MGGFWKQVFIYWCSQFKMGYLDQGLKTDVLRKGNLYIETHTQRTQGEMKAETGDTHPQVKECPLLPAATKSCEKGKGWNSPPPSRLPEGPSPASAPASATTSRTVRQ